MALNLFDADAVEEAYTSLVPFGPSLLVQKMAESGLEWFIGGKRDNQFGSVVIVGLGGIYIEILRKTAMAVGPLSQEEASPLLYESGGSALLTGVRGQSRLDRESLLDIVVRVSWLLSDFPEISELDLNPISCIS